MSKYFVVNPTVEYSSNEVVETLHNSKLNINNEAWVSRGTLAKKAIEKEPNLKHVDGRVVIKVDMESKNTHQFSDGTVIRRERRFNNLNFREVNPSNATIVSAENMQKGSQVLVDYTSITESHRIYDCESGSSDIHYYSIKEEDCYAFRLDGSEWLPTKNCEFGMRVFKPHEGIIQGVEPTEIKSYLYVTTGDLTGLVCQTLKGCDYQIVFQNDRGREGALIRFRHSADESFEREEIILVNNELTDKVNKGQLLVGYTSSDAKTIN